MDILYEIIKALWLLIPLYAANGFPVLVKGKVPIDFKKTWSDGKRIFGDGKTIEGFIIGILAGIFYGGILWILYPKFNSIAIYYGFELPYINPLNALILSFSALSGDLIGSFIKRRISLERGADAPILDQTNFILSATMIGLLFFKITVIMFLFMIIFTIIVHRITNIISYLIKLKSVPW
ncbi:MAG: CDP-2,3-bis-(O-geranylgeranyl)-sn-glycerol synthase [Candidatus Aenigmatarchaeota archaeon]|nr:CDP-2,3-bis-(O-geranylgeranyl)-sn-glycerol synthase [Candidatus Aenigmarchaeota archaeon]